MLDYLWVLALGCLGGALGGLVGTGSSLILMPALVVKFGPKSAVPIMAVAAIIGNLARVGAWRREIDWRAVAAYSLPAAPASMLGAASLIALPVRIVDLLLGLFFLVMIPTRHWLARHQLTLTLPQLALAGAFIGYITGIVLSTGPLSVPAFTAYGLAGGAFLATEAASSVFIYLSKALAFRALGALPVEIVVQGLIVGASVAFGTFAAKPLVRRIDARTFRWLIDILLLISAGTMLFSATR